MIPNRQEIEAEVERLLEILDKMDGDADLEPETVEQQHDAEAEITWASGIAPDWFIIAHRARSKIVRR
jgi:hypothetical protein